MLDRNQEFLKFGLEQEKFLEQLQIVLDPTKRSVKTASNALQDELYKQSHSLLLLSLIIVFHNTTELGDQSSE